ncbi:hypothetical protein ACFQZE_03945 [Paenibacillus sp. GCM10027627]|uniref:hypothetical protein n=1 Tax=unclassified Paenibacillus TaxID=185978 RepID=UPI003630E53D
MSSESIADSKTDENKLSKKQIKVIVAVLVAVLAVAGLLLYLLAASLSSRGSAASLHAIKEYKYETYKAESGMNIHWLMTKPAYVKLETVFDNVTLTEKVGINGGFFYGETLVSMAVVNGRALNGPMSRYGSGGENVKYARGTLVWDGEADALSVQVISKASELKTKDHTRFWAQGGISMGLGNEDGWAEQAALENAPFPDDIRLRSGAVYDKFGNLYLVVSETPGSLDTFRSAILEGVGGGQLVDGVFLDGDGSSQMLSKEMTLAGDGRPVVQMIRIAK